MLYMKLSRNEFEILFLMCISDLDGQLGELAL